MVFDSGVVAGSCPVTSSLGPVFRGMFPGGLGQPQLPCSAALFVRTALCLPVLSAQLAPDASVEGEELRWGLSEAFTLPPAVFDPAKVASPS